MLNTGTDVIVRGERATLRHVLRVPRHRDLFGSPILTSYRATVVHPDGRFSEVDLHECEPVTEPE